MSSTDCDRPSLNTLPPISYINDEEHLPEQFSGKVEIYTIFDYQHTLQYVGYSSDVLANLKQHLVRCLDHYHWVKVASINRPSRSILDEIQAHWIDKNGVVPKTPASVDDIDSHIALPRRAILHGCRSQSAHPA